MKLILTFVLFKLSFNAAAETCKRYPIFAVLNCENETKCNLVGAKVNVSKSGIYGCQYFVKDFKINPRYYPILFKMAKTEIDDKVSGVYGILLRLEERALCHPEVNPAISDEMDAYDYFVSIESGCVSLVKKYIDGPDLPLAKQLLKDSILKFPEENDTVDVNAYRYAKYKGLEKNTARFAKIDKQKFTMLFQNMAKLEPKSFELMKTELHKRCKAGSSVHCEHLKFAENLKH